MSEVLCQAEDPRPAGQHHITAPNGLTARRFVWTGQGMRIIIGRQKMWGNSLKELTVSDVYYYRNGVRGLN